MASFDWSQCNEIESRHDIRSGEWLLRGSRMPVALIFEYLEFGASLEDIMEWHEGLDRGQLEKVIGFVAQSFSSPAVH